jgi:hypothetical protein
MHEQLKISPNHSWQIKILYFYACKLSHILLCHSGAGQRNVIERRGRKGERR